MNPKNDDLIQQVDSQFRRSYSYLYARNDMVAAFQNLFALRGFWPMIPLGATADATDFSNNSRTLTTVGTIGYLNSGLLKTAYAGAGASYWTRPDEAELDITGTETYINSNRRGLTMGGWFSFGGTGATEALLSKWDAAGGQTSYLLQHDAAGTVSFFINAAGNVVTSTLVADDPPHAWWFIVATFKAQAGSGQLHLYLNDEDYQSVTVGMPVSINNTTAPFQLGAANGTLTWFWTCGMAFLTAAYSNRAEVISLYEISKAIFRAHD